jgi:hypothetical protein
MFIFCSRMSSVWGQAEKSECPWFRAILVIGVNPYSETLK